MVRLVQTVGLEMLTFRSLEVQLSPVETVGAVESTLVQGREGQEPRT